MNEKLNNKTAKFLFACILLSVFIFIFLATPLFTILAENAYSTTSQQSNAYLEIQNSERTMPYVDDEGEIRKDKNYIEYIQMEIKNLKKDLKEETDEGSIKDIRNQITIYKNDITIYNTAKSIVVFNSLFFVFASIMLFLFLGNILKEGSVVKKISTIGNILFIFTLFILGCVLTGVINKSCTTLVELGNALDVKYSFDQTCGPAIISFTLLSLILMLICSFGHIGSLTKPKEYVPKVVEPETDKTTDIKTTEENVDVELKPTEEVVQPISEDTKEINDIKE